MKMRFMRGARFAVTVLALAGALVIGGAEARADCSLKITNLKQLNFSGHFGRGYEVFDRDQHAEAAQVTIERKSGSCAFVVGFSAGGGSFAQRRLKAGGNVLNYQLYKDAGGSRVLKDIPAAGSEEVFSGVLAPGQDSVTFQFVFLIPLQQIVPPGTYGDTVMVKVYEGSLQSAQLRDQEQLKLSASVPTVAEFTLGDTVTFEQLVSDVCVDFGPLAPGVNRDLKLRARSNSGYRITLRSVNGGVMRLADPRDTSEVPYNLEVDCRPVPLGSHAATAIEQAGVTSAAGREHALKFTIGMFDNASAGLYRDVIVVTMYPSR